MPYDYIEEYQKQNDPTIWEFRDKDAQSKIDTSLTETDYANPLTFETMQAQLAKNTKIKLEPIQDLHGYDKPWVGGAGKNLLPLDVATIKSLNNGGTWSGNAYVYNNVTFTILTDSDGNIMGIKANGTANANGTRLYIVMGNLQALSGMILNCINTSLYYTVYIQRSGSPYTIYARTTGSDITIDAIDAPATNIFVEVSTGRAIDNVIMQPMIRLSTVTDSTFEPYENLCPITGRTQVGIEGCGKNLFDVAPKTTQNWNHISGTSFYHDMYIEDDILYTTAKGNGQSTIFRLKNFPSGVWSFNYKLSQPYNKRMIIRCFDNDGNNISSQIQISGFTYLSYYSGLYSTDKSPTRNFANIIIPNTVAYFNVGIGYVDDTAGVRVQISEIQLEKGSIATPYSPYQESTSLQINLGQTVYGGQVDVEKGELVVDRKTITLNGSESTWESVGGSYPQAYRLTSNIAIDGNASQDNFFVNFTNKYPKLTVNNPQYGMRFRNSHPEELLVYDARFQNDSTNFLAELSINNLQFCYYLATPITINLTPHQIQLLKGINNISTDGDKITLTYRNGVFATLEELSDLDTNVKDISDKFNALGLSVVDGKLCQTYNT